MRKTREQIRYNMQQVKNKDSEIEKLLRSALWEKGYRYRKNVKTIFGHPDIAFIGKKTVVFCDSEFWHGFDWENRKNDFCSNRDFWLKKIERNMERDREVTEHLEAEGWKVLRFWGNEIKHNLDKCISIVETALSDRKKRK